MPKDNNPLDHIKVASPCTANWEKMKGTDEVRFCDQCSLHVYNLSAMTRAEALSLIQNMEGRLCVKLYRRLDGTVITSNCPKGLRVLGRRVVRFASAVLAGILSIPGLVVGAKLSPSRHGKPVRHFAKNQARSKRHRRAKRRISVVETMGVIATVPEVEPQITPLTIDAVPAPTPQPIEMPVPPPPPEK